MLADGPEVQSTFNPHFYYTPRHVRGVTRLSFEVRMEPEAILHHEWRDAANPYRVGPTLWIRDGRLQAAGRDVMALPVGKWVKVEIACGMGPDSTGTWDLTVTPAGQAAKHFAKLPVASADWKRLDWLGFSGMARTKTTLALDDIVLGTDDPAAQD